MTSAAPQVAPSRARWGAVFLVLVQCATLAILEEGHRFGVVMGGLALLSLWERIRIRPEGTLHWMRFALLAVMLAVKHRLAPEPINEQITFFNTVIAYETARYLICLEVYQLFVNRPAGRIPGWFAAVAALSMVFASNVRLNPRTQPIAIGLCLAFVAGLAAFAALQRRRAGPRGSIALRTITAVVMLLVFVGGVALAEFVRRYESEVERWLAGQSGLASREDAAVGFSGRGELGCIQDFKQVQPHHVSLRIKSRRAPGYLRGRVFDEFHGSIWTETAEWREVAALTQPPFPLLRPNEWMYPLHASAAPSSADDMLDVWPDAGSGERLFYPLDAACVASPPMRLTINSNDMAERLDAGAATPYSVYLESTPPAFPVSETSRMRFLAVDEIQTYFLQPFANDVFAGCRTTEEKLAAVTRYFHTHFDYALQPQPVDNYEAIVDFLRERRPAHCEFFASAGTLLLRLAGVPARYVTGYVSTEWNETGRYWVARRRDAHAWIEAYDETTGQWRTVECTPPGGVPSETSAGGMSDWWDAQRQRFREWMHQATAGGAWTFVLSLPALAVTPAGLVCLVLGAAAVLLWKWRRQHLRPPAVRPAATHPELHKALKRADKLARRIGCGRRPTETLSQFAQRLRRDGEREPASASTLADWYEDYVRVRYGLDEPGPAISDLASRLRTVSAARREGRFSLSATR